LIAACGGGGSGGGGNNPPPPPPPPPPGSFTLSATTAAFSAPRLRGIPAFQNISMNVTGSDVATVGAAMPAAQAVSWLSVTISGTAPDYSISMRPNSTDLPIGSASTTVTVATANAAGTVLVSRNIQVSYDIYQGITINSPPAGQSFVYGGVETSSTSFTLNAQGRSYTLSSIDAWLTPPGAAQSGNGPVTVNLNVGALAPGNYLGFVRVTSTTDPLDFTEAAVSVTIAAPVITPSSAALLLGGEDGLGTTLEESLDFSINTGANSWPWTAQVQGFSVPAALTTPVTSGNFSEDNGATFSLSADRAQLRPGTYTATLHFETTVKNQVFVRDVPITLNWESQRLVPQYDGLSFYSNPARNPPTRQVVIRDSRGRTGIPWTASSNSPWLVITPTSGVTGDTLTVQAQPAGLTSDVIHHGDITLASSNPSIEREERIRVALWKASGPPVNISRQLTDLSGSVITSPVEPYVYTISRYLTGSPGGVNGQAGGIIRVYHVFTGDLVTTFPSGSTYPGSMTISSDGTRLFVTDYVAPRTIELDALSGAQLASHPASNNEYAGRDERHGIEFLRMNGRPVVWPAFTPYLTEVLPIDVETGQGLRSYVPGQQPGGEYSPSYDIFQVASPDGQFMYTASNASSATIMPLQQYFTVLGGGPRIRSVAGTFYARSGRVEDLCVGVDGKVWHSSGYPPLLAYDSNLENIAATLTLPAQLLTGNLICGAHGRNYVAIADSNGNGSEDNVAIFGNSGNLIGTFRHGPAGALLGPHQFKLSGDGTRLVWPTYEIVNNQLVDTLEISTVP
jgi:sugar lactone lactonase YvrE